MPITGGDHEIVGCDPTPLGKLNASMPLTSGDFGGLTTGVIAPAPTADMGTSL